MTNLEYFECRNCGTSMIKESPRSVLLDTGKRGDGTGSLFIVMPYVSSMSALAGPYCRTCALSRVRELNHDKLNQGTTEGQ